HGQPQPAALDAVRNADGHGSGGWLGYFFGGVIGAVTLLVLEEVLMAYTTHWAFILGFILLAIVLFMPNGLASLRLQRWASPRSGGKPWPPCSSSKALCVATAASSPPTISICR